MPGILLTDQMGAMAVVDQLRHTVMETEAHLDIAALRKDVAARLHAYYEGTGTRVDPALIEAGVRDYFADRLRLEVPPIPKPLARAINLYVRREEFKKPAWATTGAVFLALLVMAGADRAAELDAVRQVAAELGALHRQEDTLAARLASARNTASSLLKQAQAAALPSAEALAQAAYLSLQGASAPKTRWIASVERDSLPAAKALAAQAQAAQQPLEKVVAGAEQQVYAAEQLLQAQATLLKLQRHPSFPAAAKTWPTLQQDLASALAAVEEATLPTVEAALGKTKQVEQQVAGASEAVHLQSRLAGLTTAVEGEHFPAGDQARADAALFVVGNALKRGALAEARAAIEDAENLLSYAARPLALTIVSRAGEKSGVERSLGGGKSWFLIVDAKDANGDPVPVPVTNVETGKTERVPTFGVRVSRDEYERVRQDKMRDGHVDTRDLGSKPAHSLTLRFDPARVADAPDFITKW